MTLQSMASKLALIVPSHQVSKTARACPRLHVGWKYYVDGQPFVFDRYLEGGELIFKCIRTDLPLRSDPYDSQSSLPDNSWLISALASGRFTTKTPRKNGVSSSRRMMDEAEAREIDPSSAIRYHILVEVDRYGTRPSDYEISTSVDAVLGRYPDEATFFDSKVALDTVRTWLKRRGSYGDRTWYDCISRTGWRRSVRLPKQLLALVAEAAIHFWSDFAINYWRAYGKLQTTVNRWNADNEIEGGPESLECPSYSTFIRYADHFGTFEAVRAKYGEKAAKEVVAAGKTTPASRILETVQADHTVIDVIVLDDETGAVIGRPTLTMIIDVKSRCILGHYISFDPPCFAAVIQCLRKCLLPKVNCIGSDDFPILQDVFGLPTLLVVDNAMEFVGVNMQDAMNDLGVILLFPPVKTPEWKPFIERLFGTLNTKIFHALKGTTFNKAGQAKRLGDYKPEPSITLNALQDLVEHVIYAYHIDAHSGLDGRPPALVWQEDAVRFGIPVLYDLDRLDAMLAASAMRVLARDGIQMFDRMYNHGPTTTLALEQLEAARFDLSEKLKVKYNPYDLSCIWFYHPILREYQRLPSTDPDYSCGLSVFQHRKIKIHMKALGWAFSDPKQRLQARHDVENKIKQITPELLQEERKATARLAAKPSMVRKLEDLGLMSVTGIPLFPKEPLLSRVSDNGALPVGSARGAAKAKATREANAEARRMQDEQQHYDNSQNDDGSIDEDDADWEGFDYDQ